MVSAFCRLRLVFDASVPFVWICCWLLMAASRIASTSPSPTSPPNVSLACPCSCALCRSKYPISKTGPKSMVLAASPIDLRYAERASRNVVVAP